jgi:hypothetical protein
MTVKKPDTTSDNLMLIIGQLLEATKAAAEGLKSVSAEVQGNAKAIIAVSQTVKMVETTITDLKKIVSDATHPGNLVVMTAGHATDIKALKEALAELEKSVEALKTGFTGLNFAQVQATAEKKTNKEWLWEGAKVVGWIVTTVVALYAAFAGK